jgi:thioredoxin 1
MKVFIYFLIISFSFLGFTSSTKSEGIKFRRMTFEEAKKESLKSGKIIFIDVHTSWCGPCKKMAATSFQDPKLGEIHNDKFINLKIDAEKSEEGVEIAKNYRVQGFPTLLYINGDGRLVKSLSGFQTADKLISVANAIEN